MAEVITLVPSTQKTLQVEGAGIRTLYRRPEEIVRGLELMLGREKETEGWIETLPERIQAGVRRRLELFRRLQGKDVVLTGVLGGGAQALLIGAADRGVQVKRIPIHALHEITGNEPGLSAQERSRALRAAWDSRPDRFYTITPVDPEIATARVLTRERIAIQDLRKPMQQRFYSALRDMRLLLPIQATEVLDLVDQGARDLFHNRSLVSQIEQAMARLAELLPETEHDRVMAITRHYANPRFLIGARESEEDSERQILALLGSTPIWQAAHPGPSSSLPEIKGFGVALGGGTIAEIGDIRRFPESSHLRSYARFGLNAEGGFPRRVKGIPSSWNVDLARAMWLWSTDQVGRYDHVWRTLLLWKKAREMQQHPEPVPHPAVNRMKRAYTRYDFTLGHLHRRACRWTGSQLLEYLFDLWNAVEAGRVPEIWFQQSRWPDYFAQAEQALQEGLQAYLDTEIPLRRRAEPVEEEELEEGNAGVEEEEEE